jgi:predicted metal-dependent HD superfamily phosphohydrolase
MTDLLDQWQLLVGRHTTSALVTVVGQRLLESWAEPHRRYHTFAHLRDVLGGVDDLAEHAADPDAVRLAAWFHDAVYRGRSDDEEQSALRAERDLTALEMSGDLVAEVARLVRLTVTHDPAPGDRNGEVLSDADLAVLAVPAARYAANTAAVRAEYAHVPDQEFGAGRAGILRALLDSQFLYRTPSARQRWEASARANLQAELAGLDDTVR